MESWCKIVKPACRQAGPHWNTNNTSDSKVFVKISAIRVQLLWPIHLTCLQYRFIQNPKLQLLLDQPKPLIHQSKRPIRKMGGSLLL